jgi:hypothetical protein
MQYPEPRIYLAQFVTHFSWRLVERVHILSDMLKSPQKDMQKAVRANGGNNHYCYNGIKQKVEGFVFYHH